MRNVIRVVVACSVALAPSCSPRASDPPPAVPAVASAAAGSREDIERRVRAAVEDNAPLASLEQRIGKPPSVDTATETGLRRLHGDALRLSVEEADKLSVAARIVYWTAPDDRGVYRAIGIAWDEAGRPYYFSVPMGD